MSDTLILMALSASAAILHVLIPDHEIPLAMIGRAQNWGIKAMTLWTLVAGVIHISISMVIGFIAVGVSMALAQYIANTAHLISGSLLMAFGAVYAFLAWKGKHTHMHSHSDEHGHPHSHDSTQETHTNGSGTSVGSKGKSVFRSGGASMIAGVVGMAPCFTLIPVLVAAVPYGTETII